MVRLLPVLLASVFLPTPGAESETKMAIETLAEFVFRVRNAKGLSLKGVEHESARRGEKIAASYVGSIETGASLNPSKDKLISLAHGLGEPEDLVFAIAGGRMPKNKGDARAVQLLAHFHELPDEYKENLLKIARMFNAEHGAKSEEIKIVKKKTDGKRGSRAA